MCIIFYMNKIYGATATQKEVNCTSHRMAFSCSSALWLTSGIILPHDNARPHVDHSIQLGQLYAMRRDVLPACCPVSLPHDLNIPGVTESPQTHVGQRCEALV